MTEHPTPEDLHAALFCDDRELRRRLNPRLGWDRFRAAIRALEQTKSAGGLAFPQVKELFGGRYWPAVVAYLDDDNGVGNHDGTATEDGPEHFHATARPKARVQEGPPRPAVLDRPPGDAQPDGLPGRVHRLAARR